LTIVKMFLCYKKCIVEFAKFKREGRTIMDREEAVAYIRDFIASQRDEMTELSDYLGNNPELSGEEYESSRLFANRLASYGFNVEIPFGGLPTAFMAKRRAGGAASSSDFPVVAFLAEYDALPGIGHACGHNVHGVMSLYAGIAASLVLDSFGGEVRVVGTPAEETDGAKALLAEKGVFDDTGLALMFHSYAKESFVSYRSLALEGYEFEFTGKASHAAASPWLGISAQNGMLLFMDALNMLRLRMRDMCRLHAVVTEVSGATNIIPDKAVCRVEARAPSKALLCGIMEDVFAAANGAAMATRTGVRFDRFMRRFDDMLPNLAAESMAEDVLSAYGVKCVLKNEPLGSTDVGNVSYRCPALQPEFAITDKEMSLHTAEFAKAALSGEAHDALVTGATALAEICVRFLSDKPLRGAIRNEFLKNLASA